MALNNIHKKYIVALAIVLLFIPLFLLLFINFRETIGYTVSKFVPFLRKNSVVLNNTQFSFNSEIPGITIEKNSINTFYLTTALTKLKLYPLEKVPYIQPSQTNPRIITPKEVEIVFKPVENYAIESFKNSDLKIRQLQNVVDLNNKTIVIFVAGEIQNNSKVVIPVYIDISKLKESLDISKTLSGYALLSIFYTFHDPPLFTATHDSSNDFRTNMGSIIDKLFTVEVNKIQSFKLQNSILSSLKNLLLPKAFAACSGNTQCGITANTYSCVAGVYVGQTCSISDGSPCPGACAVTSSFCSSNGLTSACNTSGSTCIAGSCASCVFSNSCSGSTTSNYCDRSGPNTGDCTDVGVGTSCNKGAGTCYVSIPGAITECNCSANMPTNTPIPATRTPAPTAVPTSTPVPTAAPTSPPGCTCGGWSGSGACGGGGCAANQRPQTRSCNPANCSNQTQCITDIAGCTPPTNTPVAVGSSPVPTPPPPPTNTPVPPTNTPIPPTPTPQPPTVSLLVNTSSGPVTVTSGSNVTVSWTSTNTTGCTASASVATGNWSGAKAVNGSQSNVGTITSNRTIQINCTGPGGNASDSVVVNIPPTVDLKVNNSNGPVSITSGSTVSVTWTSTDTTSCTAAASTATTNWNGGVATSGTVANAGPINTARTIQINCSGPGGNTSDSVQVNIGGSTPPTVDLKVNNSNGPVTISSGSTVTTTWTSSDATSCTAFAGSLTTNWNGGVATSGTQANVGPINSSRSISITCTGPGGSVTDTVQVNINSGTPAPTVSLLVNGSTGPVTITSGSNVSAVWTSVNATSCTASASTSTTNWNGALSATSGTQNGVGPINSNRTLVVTCTGAGGTSSASVSVQMASTGPTVSLQVNGTTGSVTVPTNSNVVVTWSSTNSTSCTASATAATGNWNGAVAVNGSQANVGPIATARTLNISCTGPGGSTSDSVDINLSAVSTLPVVTLLVNGVTGPLAVPVGTTVTTTWTSSNASSCTASASVATGNWNGGKGLNGTQANVGPINGDDTLVLSCTGPGGTTIAAVDLISTAPPVCEIPNPVDPPVVACANPTGSITWKWLPVANANQYELTIVNTVTSATVAGPTWRNAIGVGGYNCGSGTCSYTTTNLSPGSYKSQLRAGSTVNNCTAPLTRSDSQNTSLALCPGVLTAQAVRVSTTDSSCAAVDAGAGIPATISFLPNVAPGPQASAGTAVTWNNVPPGNYTISATAANGYVLKNACWKNTSGSCGNVNGCSSTTTAVGSLETVSWKMGYTLGDPWTRGKDGEMIVCTDVASTIPNTTPVTSFVLNSTGSYPGIVSYGNSYDFDGSGGGATNVSSTDWLAKEAAPVICGDSSKGIAATDWYQYFANKMDVSNMTAQAIPNPVGLATFTNTITRVNGPMNTQGTWNVNKNTIIFVNGDVTINGDINISGNNFFALIVNGNINVASSVGTNVNSSTVDLQGLFITSPTGKFQTGQSTQVGKEKLNVKGTVIAGGFTLQRDLDAVSHNQDTPAEEFMYDPQLLLNMPDSFKDLRIKWQEVAP